VLHLRQLDLRRAPGVEERLTELRRRDPAMVRARQEPPSGTHDRQRRGRKLRVVAVGDEAPLLRRRVARRIEDHEIVPLASPRRRARARGAGSNADRGRSPSTTRPPGAPRTAPLLRAPPADRAPPLRAPARAARGRRAASRPACSPASAALSGTRRRTRAPR